MGYASAGTCLADSHIANIFSFRYYSCVACVKLRSMLYYNTQSGVRTPDKSLSWAGATVTAKPWLPLTARARLSAALGPLAPMSQHPSAGTSFQNIACLPRPRDP
jgi:hypothetical protein